MIQQQNYVESLRDLSADDMERALRRLLADTLDGLVAAIDSTAAKQGLAFRSCVVDEFRITRARCTGSECVVLLYYNATARRVGLGLEGEERIYGSAVVAIDEGGAAQYKGVTLNMEDVYVAPDVGGGD